MVDPSRYSFVNMMARHVEIDYITLLVLLVSGRYQPSA